MVVTKTATVSRRVVQGIDTARVSSLVAVLQKRCNINLSQCDVYVSLVGGIKVKDAGLDLAICVAMASADRDVIIPREDVFAGEVGLSGEVRPSTHITRRVREAARRGHSRIHLNVGKTSVATFEKDEIDIVECDLVAKVLGNLGL